jgi:hypothetical protein
MYSGVNRYTRGQLGVMIQTHKSISNKTEYYKLWNDRITLRIKINIGHLTILGVYATTEGREE